MVKNYLKEGTGWNFCSTDSCIIHILSASKWCLYTYLRHQYAYLQTYAIISGEVLSTDQVPIQTLPVFVLFW